MINLNDKLLEKVNEYELWLCTHIAKRMNENGAFPSNETLCKDTGWSLNTLQKHKKSLIAKKILICEKRFRDRGGQTSNNYQLTSKYIKKFTETPKENTRTQNMGTRVLGTQDLSTQHNQIMCTPHAQVLGIAPTQVLGNEVLVNLSINQSNPFSLSIKENPKNENSENEPIKPKSEQKEKFRFDVQTSESELSAISNSVYSDREAKKVQYLEDFKNDYYAVESLTRKTKMDVSQVLRAADEFATDQIAKEDFQYPTYKDFKTHFYNWLLCNNLRLIKNWNYERDQNKSGNKRVNVVPAGGENPAKELAEKLLARPDIFIKW